MGSISIYHHNISHTPVVELIQMAEHSLVADTLLKRIPNYRTNAEVR